MRWLFSSMLVSAVFIGACGGGDGGSDPAPDAMVAAACGDNTCNGNETCATCPADCGACPISCGDNTCNGTESCASCPADCGACPVSCGDGACTGGETCSTCATDCGQCPASCGNNTCETGETCANCAADCGQCVCVRGDGTCTGETVCISGSCENAFGRLWKVTISSGTVPNTNPAGAAWDFGGGAPDLFVEVDIDGSVIGRTTTAQDTFAATWNETIDVNLIAGNKLTLWVWDEDVSSNDYAFGCQWDPVPVSLLQGGIISCNFTDGTLSGFIDPK